MTNLTRRSFLKQTSVSTATLGLLPCLHALAAMPDSPQATTPGLAAAPFGGPIIAHVSDLAMGDVTLLVGAREIIFRDPQLVAHLMKAARRTFAHSTRHLAVSPISFF